MIRHVTAAYRLGIQINYDPINYDSYVFLTLLGNQICKDRSYRFGLFFLIMDTMPLLTNFVQILK